MNARELDSETQFAGLLSQFPPEIVALTKKCLPKLRRAFPVSHEIVYDYGKKLVVSFSMSERGYEGIITIAVSPESLRLYFARDVPDPAGLLDGSGSKVRGLTLESASDLDSADVQALIKAAKKHSGATFPRTRSTQMIIKSTSKKKTSKKTGHA